MTPTDIESEAPIPVQGMNRKFLPYMGKYKCNHSYINDYFHGLVKILLKISFANSESSDYIYQN